MSAGVDFNGRRPSLKKSTIDITQKPIPKNPRYQNVPATLDTGKTVKNIKPKFDTSREIFLRIKRAELDVLIERETKRQLDRKTEDAFADNDNDLHIDADAPFLLLDVRESEDYERCHIKGALNYPAIRLRRDQFFPEMYLFKNKPDKIIVIYDNDGFSKLGIDTATQFIQKLFGNTVLLSGGLCGFSDKYPMRIVGRPPTPPQTPYTSRTNTQANSVRSSRVVSVKHTPRASTFNSRLGSPTNRRNGEGSSTVSAATLQGERNERRVPILAPSSLAK